MIIPNKFITFEQSVISKLSIVLAKDFQEIEIGKLYAQTENDFDDIDQFLFALDVLHALGRISIDLESGMVRHAH
jgi:hypothetical protein